MLPVVAAFAYGADGGNICPTNYSKIADETACMAAAASVGKPYKSSQASPAYPSGCYLYTPVLYFNSDPVGAGFAGCEPLCAGAPGSAHALATTAPQRRALHAR